MGFDEIHAAADGTATICLNASGNTLDGGAGTIRLDTVTSGTINVTQLEPTAAVNILELDDANSIPTGNVFQVGTGTITFDAGVCPTP